MSTVQSVATPQRSRTYRLAVLAMLSAVAADLMALDFPIPILIPPFVKLDFSELPALLAAFSMGPLSGAVVCLVKNLIHLLMSSSNGVGELCNFLIGICFVVPAGLIYRYKKTRKGALIGALVGAAALGVCSIPVNYFITYPFYSAFWPMETIIGMYQELNPSVDGLLACLIIFNAPFSLLKGLLDTLFCFLIYKPLSPLLHK